MWLVILLTLLSAWLFFKWYISMYSYWEKRGIPTHPTKFPFGSDRNMITMKKFQGHIVDQMYYKMAPQSMFGYFNLRTPILVVRDPELIQMVLTKEFSHFRGRFALTLNDKDVLAHHLFNLEGDKWRALRVKLTPTFTSGKLKAMFPLFIECSEAFSKLLLTKANAEVDIKDLMGRLTTDIICSCAFGLDINTINEPDHKLRKITNNLFKMDYFFLLKIALIHFIPKLQRSFPLRLTPVEIEDYLINLVQTTVDHREKNNIKRNDFLDLLIELKKKGIVCEDSKDENEETCQPIEFTHDLMTAQCFIFFIAGFETSSSVQSFCLYELALNEELQSRLLNEINNTIKQHGHLTYQAINDMDYLDMVVSETMRKYPTLPFLTRCCTKPLTTATGQTIDTDTVVLIPVWSLHHDPAYFSNPEKFDPERFSIENKELIKPFTYIPFGEGPRMCIGMRFGLIQTKVGIITVLRKFKVECCPATKVPLEFSCIPSITAAKDPIVLKLVPRPELNL